MSPATGRSIASYKQGAVAMRHPIVTCTSESSPSHSTSLLAYLRTALRMAMRTVWARYGTGYEAGYGAAYGARYSAAYTAVCTGPRTCEAEFGYG